MKKLILLFVIFSFGFLVACSNEVINDKAANLSELEDVIPGEDTTEIPSETIPDLPVTEEDNRLAFEELLKEIKTKYQLQKEEAYKGFEVAFENKKIEILGEEYSLKMAELTALEIEYKTLLESFYNNPDLVTIKDQLLALSKELNTLEYNSEAYLAKVEELKNVWNSVSTKVDELKTQLLVLNEQIRVLKQEINTLYYNNLEALKEAKTTLSIDLNTKLKSIQESFTLEVNTLKETYGIEDPWYDGCYKDGFKFYYGDMNPVEKQYQDSYQQKYYYENNNYSRTKDCH